MKKIISLLIACSVLAGCCCCEKCPQKTGYAPKYRKVALHGYVYRKVKTLEETVLEAKALGADGVVCSRTQKIAERFGDAKFDIKMTPEQKEFVKKLFADNHIDFVSFGVWDIGKKETPDMYLSFCAEMGIPVFTWEGEWSKLDLWNEAAKKYGVKVAIHNHQRGMKTGRKEYKNWNPEFVWEAIKDRPYLYACADNGHWTRSGLDTPAGYRALHGRMAAIHFKDPAVFGAENKTDAAIGEGVLDIPACLAALDELGYDGYLVLENECVSDNPTETMRKGIEYLRKH